MSADSNIYISQKDTVNNDLCCHHPDYLLPETEVEIILIVSGSRQECVFVITYCGQPQVITENIYFEIIFAVFLNVLPANLAHELSTRTFTYSESEYLLF